MDYCLNRTCQNKGLCRKFFGGAKCECLQGSYSGEFCEITATRIIIYQIVSKSCAYIAILALVIVALFVIIMDILKYGFGIDPTAEFLEEVRRENAAKRRRPVAIHYVYVNPSPDQLETIEEETKI